MKLCRRTRAGGFTLIEMIITLSVFLLLAAAIFGIFGATLQSASTLQENQNREDAVQALGAWLRQSLLEIPSGGVLVSYHRDDQPFRVSGIIWGIDHNLRALDIQAQGNGNYLLRLANYREADDHLATAFADSTGPTVSAEAVAHFKTQVLENDSNLSWRTLLRDIKSANWRFRSTASTDWVDSSSEGRPLLAELTLQSSGMIGSVVDDFWIPPLQPAGGVALPVAAPAIGVNQ